MKPKTYVCNCQKCKGTKKHSSRNTPKNHIKKYGVYQANASVTGGTNDTQKAASKPEAAEASNVSKSIVKKVNLKPEFDSMVKVMEDKSQKDAAGGKEEEYECGGCHKKWKATEDPTRCPYCKVDF